jgi:hypothetical protein
MKPLGTKPKTQRLLCRQCGRRLAPHYEIKWPTVQVDDGWESPPRYTGHIYGYGARCGNYFCTLLCAYKFACHAVRAADREGKNS